MELGDSFQAFYIIWTDFGTFGLFNSVLAYNLSFLVDKIIFFGLGSAVLLTIHSIFLGVKFDYDLYKLFRRVVMLLFIIFEIVAQAYLVFTLYKMKDKIQNYINLKFLIAKRILVTLLIIVAIISIPIISFEGNKAFKHALEWDYFLGVIFFYCLTFFMWKKN